MIKAFKKLLSQSQDLQFVQDNIESVFQSLTVEPMISGLIIKDLVLTTATQNIVHGLSRPWQGFFITKSVVSVNAYWDSSASTGDNFIRKTSTIALKGSVNATVDLYIF